MEDCDFCRIVEGSEGAAKVYEDESYLAFMDTRPLNLGHLLVVPKKHYPTLFDMPSVEVGRLFAHVAEMAKAVKRALKADGLNIGQNNGRAANQIVPHVHVHVVPRYARDASGGRWPTRKTVSPSELENAAKAIRKEIEGGGGPWA